MRLLWSLILSLLCFNLTFLKSACLSVNPVIYLSLSKQIWFRDKDIPAKWTKEDKIGKCSSVGGQMNQNQNVSRIYLKASLFKHFSHPVCQTPWSHMKIFLLSLSSFFTWGIFLSRKLMDIFTWEEFMQHASFPTCTWIWNQFFLMEEFLLVWSSKIYFIKPLR